MRAEANRPGASDRTNSLPHQCWHTSSLIACCPHSLSSLQGHNPCSPCTHPVLSSFQPSCSFVVYRGRLQQQAQGKPSTQMSPSCPLRWSAAPPHTWSLGVCSGEEAQAWQVPGLYKAPNEGLLAMRRLGASGLLWSSSCSAGCVPTV